MPDAEDAGPRDTPEQVPSSQRHPRGDHQTSPWSPTFNDLDSVARLLDEHPGQVAGMIVEPVMMNAGHHPARCPATWPGLRDLLHDHGALLTFDEVKTGLTVGPGGVTAHRERHPGPRLPGQVARRRSVGRRHRRHRAS